MKDHQIAYHLSHIKRVLIPKQGKYEKRPLRIQSIKDRALQNTSKPSTYAFTRSN